MSSKQALDGSSAGLLWDGTLANQNMDPVTASCSSHASRSFFPKFRGRGHTFYQRVKGGLVINEIDHSSRAKAWGPQARCNYHSIQLDQTNDMFVQVFPACYQKGWNPARKEIIPIPVHVDTANGVMVPFTGTISKD